MEVHKAQAFLMVAEELHFGRAANRLRMAQPPLSRMIRSLERELGAELFERSTRHVALTPAGRALVEPARELVTLSQRMTEIARSAREGEIGNVRLGFAGASVHHLVGELARRVRRDRPGLTLDLHGSQLSHPGLEKLLDGSLDVVIGRWDFLPRRAHTRVIAQEELLVALPEGHRLASAATIDPRDLAGEPWVELPGGSGATLSNRLQLLARRGEFLPRVVQTAPDSATELLLVGAGVGVALTLSGVRDNIASRHVVFRPLRSDLGSVDVRVAWLADSEDPAVAAVVALCEETFPLPMS